ncbi:MAG: rod shape-determining protein MreD [Phycisphaerales bacterium]|nr:rod shape-determining protein MreD [Phycisphaerales bacterium]
MMYALHLGELGGWVHAGKHWPRIEYLLILAIFYALFAAEGAGPMCGFICGMLYDMGDGLFVGTTAVPLALMTLMVVRVRLSIFREHFASQVVMTFLAIGVFAVLSVMMRKLVGGPLEGGVAGHLGHVVVNGLYTALVAPLFYRVFFRFQGVLGFSSHGPRGRIHEIRR